MKAGGVYEITNIVNGHNYIGSSVNMELRWRDHRKQLRSGVHHSKYLQRAWRIYGEPAFVFKPLLVCADANLLPFEQRAIDILRPSYNCCRIAGSVLGTVRTAATRLKISQAKRCYQVSEEARRNISAALTGKKRKPFSEDHLRRLSDAAKRRKRAPMSQETREKIAASKRGRLLNLETRTYGEAP